MVGLSGITGNTETVWTFQQHCELKRDIFVAFTYGRCRI